MTCALGRTAGRRVGKGCGADRVRCVRAPESPLEQLVEPQRAMRVISVLVGASILLVALSQLALIDAYAFTARQAVPVRSRAVAVAVASPGRLSGSGRGGGVRREGVSMGKVAQFGIFSPAVLAAKYVLGEKTLNKLRGQGITLHSQVNRGTGMS